MAWVTMVQYAGTAVTPFLGSLFVILCHGNGNGGEVDDFYDEDVGEGNYQA